MLQQQLLTAMFAVPDFQFSKLGSKWKKHVSLEVQYISTLCLHSSVKNINKH
jgi:hypothetical protein